ncbi:MAG: hypothetical protein MK132_08380 [Lentisphaerales bacterium]|nr:hypothetical protein [Lentisphaerales bacterium]
MKHLLSLLIPLLLLTSCEEKTRFALKEGTDVTNITWKNYYKSCGANNLKKVENFKIVKGTVVTWTGKVYQVQKDAGAEEMRKFDSHIIRVKMPGSNSLMADVTLRIPKGEQKHRKYKKGDYVTFRGPVKYLGSSMNDHIVEVERFKKVIPKVKF